MQGEGANVERPDVSGVSTAGSGDPADGNGQGHLSLLLRTLPEGLRRAEPVAGSEGQHTIIRQLSQLASRSKKSQDVIGAAAHMKKQQLNAILTGKTKSPGINVLERIANALGYRIALVPLDSDTADR